MDEVQLKIEGLKSKIDSTLAILGGKKDIDTFYELSTELKKDLIVLSQLQAESNVSNELSKVAEVNLTQTIINRIDHWDGEDLSLIFEQIQADLQAILD